jgi:hypothetical protein
MRLFSLVTQGFIDFFGITQPTPQQERRAAWFICSLLILMVISATLVFMVVVLAFGR